MKAFIITGVVTSTNHNRKFPIVQNCPFFKVDDLRIVDDWNDATDGSSFHTLTPINNPIEVANENITVKIDKGRTCLIPSVFGNYKIKNIAKQDTTVIKSKL